jgi:hypothetical protein
MKKTAFVPAADLLESRIAMSSGIRFVGGLPVLTPNALNATFAAIDSAYRTFATRGHNYNLLGHNLAKAVSRIPFNVRDGLQAVVLAAPAALKADIAAGLPLPVIFESQTTQADVTAFVQTEVINGVFVYA